MKYLGLHKLIWLVILIVFTLFEMAMICVAYAVYILWNFKLPPNLWKIMHTSSKTDEMCGVVYKDKNPIETIKRRYEFENVSL
jgi:hypothetical protein